MSDTLGWLGGISHTVGGIAEAALHGSEAAEPYLESVPILGGLLAGAEGISGIGKALGPHTGTQEEQHNETSAELGDAAWGPGAFLAGLLGPEVAIPLGLATIGSEAAFGVGPGAALSNSWNGLNPDGSRSAAYFAPPTTPMSYHPDENYTMPDRETELNATQDPNNPFVKAAIAQGAW